MRLPPLAAILLAAALAGCSDPGPGGESTTTTSTTQEPAPVVQWVWVNRTLNITGTNGGGTGQGFQALPGNENCAYFQRIAEAGLTSLVVTAEGENPETVDAWDLRAQFPGASQSNLTKEATGLLPLTLDVPTLEIRPSQSELRIWLETTRSVGSTAVQSHASLSIRLGVMAPDALYVADGTMSCST